jgi:hypothetical protein
VLRDQFCEDIKAKFPVISAKAEKLYRNFWGDIDSELYSYTWFESLANAVNNEMNRGGSPKEYEELFSTMGNYFIRGSDDVKKAIDVAFVENLFLGVSSNASRLYWDSLPEIIKKLYFDFHRKKPY